MAGPVLVIGAGASGIYAGAQLKQNGVAFEIFEQSPTFGGTWVFHEGLFDAYNQPVHSSCYRGLKSNLPKHVMEFPGRPFPQEAPDFISPDIVLKYFEKIMHDYSLEENIIFGRRVDNVEFIGKEGEKERWCVESTNVQTGERFVQEYGGVLVCTGRFRWPQPMNIKGKENFKGRLLHSHDYKFKEEFTRQKVLIVGSGFSAADLVIELSEVCDKVYFSHRNDKLNVDDLPSTIGIFGEVSITADGRIQHGGKAYDVDTIISCTGYKIVYPMLNDLITVEQHRIVRPLFRHMIHMRHPSLAIIGLPYKNIPFVMFHLQIIYYIRLLLGQIKTPSYEEMVKDLEDDLAYRKSINMDGKYTHNFDGELHWDYLRWFADQMPDVERWTARAEIDYERTFKARLDYPRSYRTSMKF